GRAAAASRGAPRGFPFALPQERHGPVARQTRARGGVCQQAGPRPPAGLDVRIVLAPVPTDEGSLCWYLFPPHPEAPPVVPEAEMLLAEPDETLVADPRGGLTPAQQVDQRVLAVLRTGHSERFSQAAGRPQDVRRIPGRR